MRTDFHGVRLTRAKLLLLLLLNALPVACWAQVLHVVP